MLFLDIGCFLFNDLWDKSAKFFKDQCDHFEIRFSKTKNWMLSVCKSWMQFLYVCVGCCLMYNVLSDLVKKIKSSCFLEKISSDGFYLGFDFCDRTQFLTSASSIRSHGNKKNLLNVFINMYSYLLLKLVLREISSGGVNVI